MSKSLGKILGTLAPVAAAFIPGIGPLGAAALGAGGGLLSGGGLKGAITGGITGGLGGGLGSQIGEGILGAGADAGLTHAIGGALTGASAGIGSGKGIGGALTGAALGGLGGYAGNGGLSGTSFGNLFGAGEPPELGSIVDTGADSSNFEHQALTNAGLHASSGSEGFGSSLSSALSGGTGGGASSYLPALAGGALSLNANNQAQKDLLKSQQNSMNVLQPYLNSGSAANSKLGDLLGLNGGGVDTASILASDPSYKFQLDQGNQALDRANASRGGFYSGAALKQAQDYGQGLANKTVNDYYGKLAQQSGAGQNAANSAGTIYGNTGSAQANAGISSANIANQTLGSLFGSGAYKKNPYAMGY